MPVKKRVSNKQDDSKLFAFLAVLLSVVGFVLAILIKREDKYVMFYAKQSLILFISWVIASGIRIVPFVGKFVSMVLWVIFVLLWIIALVNSLSGKEKETPLIGHYARGIDL